MHVGVPFFFLKYRVHIGIKANISAEEIDKVHIHAPMGVRMSLKQEEIKSFVSILRSIFSSE